jgi:hypothetical protein
MIHQHAARMRGSSRRKPDRERLGDDEFGRVLDRALVGVDAEVADRGPLQGIRICRCVVGDPAQVRGGLADQRGRLADASCRLVRGA